MKTEYPNINFEKVNPGSDSWFGYRGERVSPILVVSPSVNGGYIINFCCTMTAAEITDLSEFLLELKKANP